MSVDTALRIAYIPCIETLTRIAEMAKYLFPLLVITLCVAMFAPMAVDHVSGLILDLATHTAQKMN